MIKISKDGLTEHYNHVNDLIRRHKNVPRQAVNVIGNLTLREAKQLATDRIKKGAKSGNYRRSINVQYRGEDMTYSAIIGANTEYAPHLEYGTRPHIIRPKKAGGVLAWKSVKTERTTRVKAGLTKKGKQKYTNMLFTKYVNHPGTKPKWILRDAIFNIAPQHIPIITHYLNQGAKI